MRSVLGDLELADLRLPILWWLGLFLVTFNHFAMTSLVGPVVRDTGTSVNNYQSVLVLRALVAALAIPTALDLGRMYGERKLMTVALLVFIIGAIVAAVGSTALALIGGFSILCGLAAAPLAALPWARVDNLPPGQRRDIAFMALPLAFSAATAAAPAVAAFLAQTAGWRWSFVPQIVLAGALLLVVRWVPATPTKARMPIDWPGAMMALAGTAAILGGVTLGDEYGWWQAAKQYLILGTWPWPFSLSVAPVLILTGAGLIGLWLYRRRNRSARSRVSPFRVGTLGRRSFFATVVTGGLHNMAIGGLMFAFFVYVPFAFALRGLATTIAILPFTLATLAASFLIPLFSRRLAPRRLLQAGLVVGCAGALVLITAISPEGSLVGLIPGLLLSGLGAGVVWAQVPRLVHASTADEPNEEATGVSNSMQLLGNSVGTALLGGLFMVIAAALLVHGVAEQLGATLTAERQGELIQQMSDLLRTLRPEEVRQHVSQLPAEIRAAVADTGRAAADGAMRLTLVAIAGTLALALAISAIAPPDERQTD